MVFSVPVVEGVGQASAARAERFRASIDQRAGPNLAKVRLALAQRSKPVVRWFIAKYPAAPAWVRVALGPLLPVRASAAGAGADADSADSQYESDLAVFVGDTVGWILLVMGAMSTLYFTVFRETPADHLPDDATVEVKQVPADDGRDVVVCLLVHFFYFLFFSFQMIMAHPLAVHEAAFTRMLFYFESHLATTVITACTHLS